MNKHATVLVRPPESISFADEVQLHILEDRIEKLEILLLRTSITEFQTIDAEILHMLPKCVSRAVVDTGSDAEAEASRKECELQSADPLRAASQVAPSGVNTPPKTSSNKRECEQCEQFDIHSMVLLVCPVFVGVSGFSN